MKSERSVESMDRGLFDQKSAFCDSQIVSSERD